MSKFFSITIACIILFPLAATGALQTLENDELDEVTGQAGITLVVKETQIFQNIEQYRYCASENGYLILENIQSDVMKYNFASYTGLIDMDAGVNEVASLDDWDLNTNPTLVNKGMFGSVAPNWEQEVSYQVDSFIFSDGTNAYDLGALWLGQIRQPSWKYFMAPHEGGSGVDFEYGFEMHVDAFAYAYQFGTGTPVVSKALAFENIHIGQSFGFGTAGDDPADPNTWTSNIGEFKIGDIFGDLANNEHARPGQIDAGVCQFDYGTIGTQPVGSYRIRLPLTGSIRFEKADFGSVDFGPGAIDGINAYRFEVYLIP